MLLVCLEIHFSHQNERVSDIFVEWLKGEKLQFFTRGFEEEMDAVFTGTVFVCP
ncbi:hypothetical protein KP78_06450 [Jeotgalibacillus soli]|uniref:Uncharacterized protein n=1 Tax=Jeotgalibacillus soli TaxID=889306 RepID=A0A0C2S9K8_9BACL|nr:hypothetical protein KP78_06450 [Jeotgalibacillus soli]